MATLEELDEKLDKIIELKSWLYGSDGHEGDIPEIKAVGKSHEKRIHRVELIIAGIIGSGALGGGVVGLIKLIG